jgi:hypothetical protein
MHFLDPIVKLLKQIYQQLVAYGLKEDSTNAKLDQLIALLTPSPTEPNVASFAITIDPPTKQ